MAMRYAVLATRVTLSQQRQKQANTRRAPLGQVQRGATTKRVHNCRSAHAYFPSDGISLITQARCCPLGCTAHDNGMQRGGKKTDALDKPMPTRAKSLFVCYSHHPILAAVIHVLFQYLRSYCMSFFSLSKRLVLYHFIVCCSLLLLSGATLQLPAQSNPYCCYNMPVTITPVSAQNPCCVTISCRPNCTDVYSVEVHERNFGSWSSISVSNFVRNGLTGAVSFQVCVSPGYHVLRLSLKDAFGNLICTKDVVYSCGTTDCCSNISIQGDALQNINNPDFCCVTISGSVPPECIAVETWNIEQLVNGQWTAVTSASVTASTSFSLSQCLWRADGPFTFRVVFKDFLGNTICSKDLSYDCNDHTCCQSFDFQIIPRASSDPTQCCFTLQGTDDPACNFGAEYTLEEFVNGQWQNIMGGAYQPLNNHAFTMDLCRTKGSYKFRAILRSGPPGGEDIYCVKEATYTCEASCCSSINVDITSVTPQTTCCWLSANINFGSCLNLISYYKVEYFVAGEWTGNGTNYSTSATAYNGCMPFGATKVRFVFYNASGVLCVREIEVACVNACCDLLQINLSAQTSTTQCCFNIDLQIPSCLVPTILTVSEMDRYGRWHQTSSSTYNNPGWYIWMNYCLRYDASPARIRFDFYDPNGTLLCSREFTYECRYTDTGGPGGTFPPGKFGASTPSGELHSIVQNISYAPNPAVDETMLSYVLSTEVPVQIELVDALGNRELVQNTTQQAQGLHTLPIKTSHLSAGMYTLVIKAGAQHINTNIMVTK